MAIELGLIGGVNDFVLTYFPELPESDLAPGTGKIRIHDLLTMHYGRFQGHQLLNREWMEAASSPKTGNGKYGYFWGTEDFRADGNLVQTISGRGARGQFIFMMPQLALVVVVTSSNDNKTRRAPFVFVPELILPAFL
ncbi:hypothetical protein [Endozoicomonas atrinae]|uniref:hypothetical protein n=1 Tax=Endozoicomonas atrinae TaxID=1333660 RepID=UPI0008240A17|nr:hypothetical protein [Endozoicomonas atrinae]